MRAAIYSRISRAEDGDRSGVERHAELCRQLCELRDYEVVDVYEDNDLSATSKRPSYERLLKDLPSPKFDFVVAYEQSRLARDEIDWATFRNTYVSSGKSLIEFVRGGTTDLSSSAGRTTSGIMSVVDAAEKERIRQRITDKHQEIAAKGLYHGGRRPFGYEPVKLPGAKQGSTLRIREDEAVLVREAADKILEGRSLYGICRDWNERGEPTVKGGPWTATSLRRILRSPIIAGIREHYEARVPAQWPGILTERTWQQVCTVLGNPARQPRKPNKARSYPLAGVLICGACGRRLTGMNRGTAENVHRKYGCRLVPVGKNEQTGSLKGGYGCGKVYIDADWAESWIKFRFVPWADDPRMRSSLAAEAGVEAERIRQLVAENAADETTLVELDEARWQRQEILHSVYLSQGAALRGRIEGRQAELASLRGQSTLDRFSGGIVEHWDSMIPEEQRSIILALVESVVVDPHDRSKGNHFQPGRMRFQWRSTEMLREGEMIDEYGNIYRAEIKAVS